MNLPTEIRVLGATALFTAAPVFLPWPRPSWRERLRALDHDALAELQNELARA